MNGNIPPFVARYGLAPLTYLIASVGTTVFWDPLFQYVPFALFFAAVSATAWFSGFWPGFIVALSGALTTAYLMATAERAALGAPFTLLGVATFICYLAEHRSRSRSRLEEINIVLETERDRLEALLHQMPAGVVIAEAPSGEVILANRRVNEILGPPPEGKKALAYYSQYQGFHADGQPYKLEEYPLARSVMTGEQITNQETEYLCGDGVRRIINTNAGPIRDRNGKVVAGLVVFDDITERKRMEQQFRQAQRMEAVGRLAGGVAHDFNNLLTVILGQSQMMLESLSSNDPLREPIQQIDAGAQRAADLTKQLLAFSRKQVLQPKVLDLNTLVSDLVKLLHRLLGEDIELITRLSPVIGRFRADPGQIEQVILNLAINARDAMPNGGRLTIETNNASLDDQYAKQHAEVRAGLYVMLAISDNGIGMDKETQSRIFEPFFTTKELGQGTGLGLATVYGIVKQSDGHIWVYSEPHRGTTFKVYFPRVEASVGVLPQSQERIQQSTGSETVLVVEDDDSVRGLVRQVMSSAGYTVMECRNANQAISMSSNYSGRIDLMITDVVMPGASGRELAQQITGLRSGIRVLFMSGYTDNAIVRHGVLDEGVAFIEKPFSPAKLLRKVREVMDA
jgi:two-component system cell cycle sensor histidine kinase/response regulator CckA